MSDSQYTYGRRMSDRQTAFTNPALTFDASRPEGPPSEHQHRAITSTVVSRVGLAMGIELAHQRISKAGKVAKGSCRRLPRRLDLLTELPLKFSSAQSSSASLAYRSSYHMSHRYRCVSFSSGVALAPVLWKISPGFGGSSTQASGADSESLTSTCYRRYGWKELEDPMGKRNLSSSP